MILPNNEDDVEYISKREKWTTVEVWEDDPDDGILPFWPSEPSSAKPCS